MLKRIIPFRIFFFLILLLPSTFYGQEKKPLDAPPAAVVVSNVRTGIIAPEAEFVGTVFYLEVSEVAAESNGRIDAVHFEEGQRLKKGHILVRLNSDLLEKTLQGAKASHEQVLSDLEKARKDLSRIENLYQRQVVPQQTYDENRFRVKGLENRAASLLAEVERLQIELRRTAVRAPFDGVVIKKHVDRGEWLQAGSTVATLARDEIVDIILDVPEGILKFIRVGMEVSVRAGGKEKRGKVFTFIPRGDVATRTFPIKVRMDNHHSLVEGMEAKVSLPTAERKKSLMVPRDALISQFGQNVIFAVINSKVSAIPVKVIGYQGNLASVEGEGLSEGMKVAIKGNERLRDGQSVRILPEGK